MTIGCSKKDSIQLSPEGEVNSGAKRGSIYLALFTDPEGDSCFSIYQISWIKMKKVTFWKWKTSLSRNLIYNLQTFLVFWRSCCKFSMKIYFLPTSRWPVNTDQPKIVAFLVFVCTTASLIAQISSSENASRRDAILASVAKDIPSYGSQSKGAKSAIHWFGKRNLFEKMLSNKIRRNPDKNLTSG